MRSGFVFNYLVKDNSGFVHVIIACCIVFLIALLFLSSDAGYIGAQYCGNIRL